MRVDVLPFSEPSLRLRWPAFNGARKQLDLTPGPQLAGEAPNYVTIIDAGTGWNAQSLRLNNGN